MTKKMEHKMKDLKDFLDELENKFVEQEGLFHEENSEEDNEELVQSKQHFFIFLEEARKSIFT